MLILDATQTAEALPFDRLIPALRDGQDFPPQADPGSDGGWGRGPDRPPTPQDPPRGGGIPLPDAEQARIRLRDHRKLADLHPARERRPTREPERTPVKIG